MAKKLTATLQENLITILSYDEDSGKIVANTVDPSLFEAEYRTVAERVVDYWRKFKGPPKDHTPDLFADILEDPHNRRAATFKRILSNMVILAPTVNKVYVLDQLRTFMRLQRFKVAILRSAEQINSRQEASLEEVEGILNELLRSREIDFSAGTRLSDVGSIMSALETTVPEFTFGIKEFDDAGITPARGEAVLLIAPKGVGKTWFCINAGRQALLRRKRVLHISLEMDEKQVAKRYYQSMFSASKRDEKIQQVRIKRNSLGKVDRLELEDVRPEFSLDSDDLYEEVKSRAMHLGSRLNNLIIKRFPTSSLTVAQLEAYLDMLETVEGFIPDMVIVDYLGIMKVDTNNYRISLGRSFEDLRGMSILRNFALIAPHQASRAGAEAALVTSGHIAEAWMLTGTADNVITMTKTEAEKQLGLARLWVSHARGEHDAFGVLLTQSYDMGQYVLDSIYLGSDYKDRLKALTKENEIDEESDDDD